MPVALAVAVLSAQETISLVALDREGQPVADLKAGEIQLTDNGQARPLSSCMTC
jgi:hypothetical protein